MGWTRSKSDNGGRVIEVGTFSGSSLPAPWGVNANSTGVVTTAYDGSYTTVTDQAGKVRRSKVNTLGQLVRVDEPNTSNSLGTIDNPTQPTSYTYDVLGNLTQVNQGGQTRSFSYSSLSRLTSATNPEVHNAQGTPVPTTYQYDANSNLTLRTDARGVATTYIYDALNRVISRSYSDGTPTVTYTYDTLLNGKGRLTSVSSSVSTYNYLGYDSLGRATGSSQVTDGVTYPMPEYKYDLASNLTSQKYPSGRIVETRYDAAGRIAGVKKQGSNEYYAGAASDNQNRIKYSAHGAIAEMKLGNNLWEHTSFNTRFQPTEFGLGTQQSGVERLKLNYSYGTTANNGNVLGQTISVPGGVTLSQSYLYDELNRLKSAQENGGMSWKQAYSYDRHGNRTFDAAQTTIPSPLQNPSINTANNRINANQGYGYDIAGNLTSASNQTFTYDAENRQMSYNGGNPISGGGMFSYDGDGRRVKKIASSGTTIFIYDVMGQLVAEYTDNPTAQPSGGTSYLTTDNLGTPRVITGADGSVKARRDYFPFGEEISPGVGGRTINQGYGQPDGVRNRYTGKERDDETGLDYFINRYYSSAQGRFTSPDPLLASGRVARPQSWNRYAYVLNNPLRLVDPNGLIEKDPHELGHSGPQQETQQQSQSTVTITASDINVQFSSYPQGNADPAARVNVSAEANALLNQAAAQMTTNNLNTMIAVNTIEQYPITSEQSSVGISLQVNLLGVSGQASATSQVTVRTADQALGEMVRANDVIQVQLTKQLSTMVSPVHGRPEGAPLGQVPAVNAPNIASSFSLTARKLANKVARDTYQQNFPRRELPKAFQPPPAPCSLCLQTGSPPDF